MKVIVLAALALVLSLQQELAHAQCEEVFSSSSYSFVAFDSTDRLISYLSQLLENNAIGERELVTLREGANPISHKTTGYGPVFDSAARQIQYDVVQRHMQSGALDHAQIKAWVDQKLKEKSEVRKSREEARVETQDVYRKMEFHRVDLGKFTTGGTDSQLVLEMMSTPITQKMWVDVMGENPSNFEKGPDTIEVEINGKKVWMQPDHPVETVTWWSVIAFANRLSELNGLKPVYDLRSVITKGRAESGNLIGISGTVEINAPDGDIYQAEGFRLPTHAEQEFVLRDLGRAKDSFPHEDYGWFAKNSGGITQAVGTTRKSLSIDGKVFDDLIGNVNEWSHDLPRAFLAGVKSDAMRDHGARYHGGSIADTLWIIGGIGGVQYGGTQSCATGARLVRTIR